MYNRILKRPMLKRGGPSFQSQGTGITSPYDTPRTIGGGAIRGNPMGNRTGFDEPQVNIEDFYVDNTAERLQEIGTKKQEIWEPKEGEWLSDVIGSFGAYGNPYKASGEAKTTGEMGYEQAASITQIRKDRKDKQDLAALSGLESEETLLLKQQEQAADLNTRNLIQKLTNKGALDVAKVANAFENTVTGGSIKKIEERTDLNRDTKNRLILQVIMGTDTPKMIVDVFNGLIANASANMKDIDEDEVALKAAEIVGNIIKSAGFGEVFARGGRAGYQMGTPQTGAMPVQASATEQIVTPNADITETETVTEGQQPTVQMPYQEFRAAIPAEVSDEIVQLIYYNEDAFADFSQITSQADVYAFNNKYGVSLVLPIDTETA